MRVVGITGLSGAGKTTALRAVESLGGAALDCDRIYGGLLGTSAEMLGDIAGRFPGTVRDGRLDRRALARQVFGDREALSALCGITHPRVLREVRERLEAERRQGRALAAVDAFEIFDSGIAELCDDTVLVTAPEEVRVLRIMERDGIPRELALERVRAQRAEGLRERCGYELINNFSDSGEFFLYCREFFRRFI